MMPNLSNDFRYSEYTAIVSDLHLCEAEPIHPQFPLWKKFKTRQFFFDRTFEKFLDHLQEKANRQPVELILNGDIFDFDSVVSLPASPSFRIKWLERRRGLLPRPERSQYKIEAIIKDHPVFISALRKFIENGNRVIFILGNHDLELHFSNVQKFILKNLCASEEEAKRVRFVEWFYISNQDTLVEHGNQYDPYCVCEDPINPFSQGYNYQFIRLPFGNLACRYILNGMGFFNPHVDSNYIMSISEYVKFFFKYMFRAQPDLILVWLGGSLLTLWYSFWDRSYRSIKDPLKIEDRVNQVAINANAEPRMVRELKELFVPPATSNVLLIARELWLDRAFLILVSFLIILQLMLIVKQIFGISLFYGFIPLFLLLPFFLFYSKSVTSLVSSYKEPDESILTTASAITRVQRIVFGHTHLPRHEMIGSVEHLNSGTWSPAFLDVECTQAVDQKTFIWISNQGAKKRREAQLLVFNDDGSRRAIPRRAQKKHT
jgi:UDP-2,3-diacylglucosamine pyrophosphatase LpxH